MHVTIFRTEKQVIGESQLITTDKGGPPLKWMRLAALIGCGLLSILAIAYHAGTFTASPTGNIRERIADLEHKMQLDLGGEEIIAIQSALEWINEVQLMEAALDRYAIEIKTKNKMERRAGIYGLQSSKTVDWPDPFRIKSCYDHALITFEKAYSDYRQNRRQIRNNFERNYWVLMGAISAQSLADREEEDPDSETLQTALALLNEADQIWNRALKRFYRDITLVS